LYLAASGRSTARRPTGLARGGAVRRGLAAVVGDVRGAAAGAFAPTLVRSLVSDVPPAIRFEAKVPNHPAAFCRVDSGVVYVGLDGLARMVAVVRELARRHPRGFRAATPIFTQALARGIGLAESPAEGEGAPHESFGEQRCRLVASPILAALEEGRPAASWPRRMAEALRSEGVDPAHPCLREIGWNALERRLPELAS
jgi:hypothetical protein